MISNRSANPALNTKTFTGFNSAVLSGETMSLNGTVNKSSLLLLILMICAGFTWDKFFVSSDPASVLPWLILGGIGGLVTGMITIFKREKAMYTAPVYAAFQGLFLGGLSAMFEARYPGIVIQAVALTFGTFAVLLLAYKTKLIKPTENFKLGVTAATGGIAVVYLVNMVMSFFGSSIGFVTGNSLFGIGFSLFVVGIAALNLVLDFDFIEQGVEQGAPKYMEWVGAFGLMVTLIWLYIEFLRLLSKLRSRN